MDELLCSVQRRRKPTRTSSKPKHHHGTAVTNKTKPVKVVYISNPMRVKTSAAKFKALVQQLTGCHSEFPDDPSKFGGSDCSGEERVNPAGSGDVIGQEDDGGGVSVSVSVSGSGGGGGRIVSLPKTAMGSVQDPDTSDGHHRHHHSEEQQQPQSQSTGDTSADAGCYEPFDDVVCLPMLDLTGMLSSSLSYEPPSMGMEQV